MDTFVGTSVDTLVGRFVGPFVGSPRRAETGKGTFVGTLLGTLAGGLVSAFVGPLMAILVDPFVGSNFAVRVLYAFRISFPGTKNGKSSKLWQNSEHFFANSGRKNAELGGFWFRAFSHLKSSPTLAHLQGCL